MTRTSHGRDRLRCEDGVAMVWAVIAMIVIVGMTLVMIASSGALSRDARRQAQSTAGDTPLQAAITTYQSALRGGIARESNGFQLTGVDACRLLEPTGVICAGASLGSRTFLSAGSAEVPTSFQPPNCIGIPAPCTFTVRSQATADNGIVHRSYWQIYKVIAPQYNMLGIDPLRNTNLTVYFRTWSGGSTLVSSGKSKITRVEFHPGGFSDFQILSDGPIQIENNATINGHIQSNGFLDTVHDPRPNIDDKLRVWEINPGAITSCAGPYAEVSTAHGAIDADISSRCGDEKVIAESRRFVNFTRVKDSVNLIRKDCITSPSTAYCFNSPVATDPNMFWEIRQTGALITVQEMATTTGTPIAISTVSLPVATTRTILVDRDVHLYGNANQTGRLTIASWVRRSDASDVSVDDGSIFLYTNWGRNKTCASCNRDAAYGLIAQGNVVPVMKDGACPVSTIRAAIIAATGGFTIPPDYTTDMFQDASVRMPQCSSLTVEGSISSRHSPNMYWYWGSPPPAVPINWAGYLSRNYTWDENLLRNPPPYFTISSQWKVAVTRQADQGCLLDPAAPTTC